MGSFQQLGKSAFSACMLAGSIITPVATAQDARQARQSQAKEPPAVKSIEARAGRELTVLPAEGAVFQQRVPIRTVPADAIGGLRLHTVAIIRNGRLLDPGLIDCQVDAASETLVLKAELAKLADAGTYTVKLDAGPADASLPAPPMLEFALSRPAAELQLNAPLRLERVVFLWGYSWWRPTQAALTERSGKSAVTPLSTEWICELRGDGGRPAGRIQLVLPPTIGPGKQGQICVKDKEAPSLGKSTGTLVVRSPQLATEVFEATVEVTSRVCEFWLLATIAVGIGFGYWARVGLEGRYRTQQAAVFAAERLQSIETAINKAKDPTLKTDLESIRDALQSERNRATATPETIEAAARAAETKLADRLRKFTEQEAALRTKIATLRTDLGLPDRQPKSVAAILREAETNLAGAARTVNDGELTAAESSLDNLRERILGKLQGFGEEWTVQLQRALKSFSPWLQTRLPEVADRINSQIKELGGKNEIKPLLQSTRQLQSDCAGGLLGFAAPEIVEQARDIHRRLADGHEPNVANELTALQQAADAVESARAEASSESLATLAEKVQLLREALVATLKAANPRPAADHAAEPIDGLADENFDKALKVVLDRRSGERLLATARGIGPADAGPIAPQPRLEDVRTAGSFTWDIALEAPSIAVAGQPVVLRVRVIGAPDAVPPLARVRWYINDVLAKEGPQELEYTLLVLQPSTWAVHVQADSTTGENREARLTLQVGPSELGAPLPDLVKQMKKTERKLTLVSGILIAVIGVLLYRNVFVGDLGDFATAFFWGFSTDIGLAKVRELSGPLVSRLSHPTTAPAGR
jgi:hypothetical protein